MILTGKWALGEMLQAFHRQICLLLYVSRDLYAFKSDDSTHKIKFSRDPTHAAIRKMRIMHRTYHSYRDRVQKSLSCVSGLGITENMLKHEIPCFDCIMADERTPCRKHHNSDINKFEKQFDPGEAWCFDGGNCQSIQERISLRYSFHRYYSIFWSRLFANFFLW